MVGAASSLLLGRGQADTAGGRGVLDLTTVSLDQLLVVEGFTLTTQLATDEPVNRITVGLFINGNQVDRKTNSSRWDLNWSGSTDGSVEVQLKALDDPANATNIVSVELEKIVGSQAQAQQESASTSGGPNECEGSGEDPDSYARAALASSGFGYVGWVRDSDHKIASALVLEACQRGRNPDEIAGLYAREVMPVVYPSVCGRDWHSFIPAFVRAPEGERAVLRELTTDTPEILTGLDNGSRFHVIARESSASGKASERSPIVRSIVIEGNSATFHEVASPDGLLCGYLHTEAIEVLSPGAPSHRP